jgi:hypothetical protein
MPHLYILRPYEGSLKALLRLYYERGDLRGAHPPYIVVYVHEDARYIEP